MASWRRLYPTALLSTGSASFIRFFLFSVERSTLLTGRKVVPSDHPNVSRDIYGIQDYLLLAAVILSTVLVLVTLISILSAFAKTIKEAQTYAMPVMLLAMGLGITGMFGGGASQELTSYCIPLYNSVQCMSGIFSFSVLPLGVAVTVGVNLLLTMLGVVVLAWMFNNEKIVFSR